MAEAGGAGSDLDRWLEPFLEVLGHKKRRTWAPLYLRGLLGPSERKSVQPMAASLGLSGHDQLQHFIASPAWDDGPLWRVLVQVQGAPRGRCAEGGGSPLSPSERLDRSGIVGQRLILLMVSARLVTSSG